MRLRIMARASAVLPAPRPPARTTRSPGVKTRARRAPSAAVAASSASGMVWPATVSGPGRRLLGAACCAGIGRQVDHYPAAVGLAALEAHRSAVEVDEGLDDREAQ